MPNLEPIAGGATGVGGTVLVRETQDQKGGLYGSAGSLTERMTRPSVLYGVGTGSIAGLLYYLDSERIMDTTPLGIDNSFWGTHALTAIPAGLVSAFFPVSGGSSNGTTQTRSATRRVDTKSDAGGAEGADFEPAGGRPGVDYEDAG